jgi:hypothetical protein
MNTSERMKLALLGNRDSRNILIRDSNRLVSRTVLKARDSRRRARANFSVKLVDERFFEISESQND